MRISTAQLYQRTVSVMLEQQARLAQTQEQLASGRRILRPSDDPSGTAQALRLREALTATEQYQRAGRQARAWLNLEETALTGAGNVLQRARELAVRGRNDTLSDGDRAAVAGEVRALEEELLRLANTRTAGGEYLFAGHRTAEPAFVSGPTGVVYQGDGGQRAVELAPGRRITVNHPGGRAFMEVPDGSGGTESLFATLRALADALENPADPAFQAEMGRLIDQLERGQDQVSRLRAETGNRMQAVDVQAEFNEELKLQLQKTLSEVQDLDYAEAVARLNRQLVGLEAAQKTFTRVQGLTLFDYL